MNRKLNLYVPQWQGSGPTDELYYGAAALKGYVEKRNVSFREIPLPPAGETLRRENNILGYSRIRSQLDKIQRLLIETGPEKIFTVGGGCGIEIPLVSYLRERHGPLDVIWFDAHGDLNSPESSPSKYFHGMPLRFLLEDIADNGISDSFGRIRPEELILAGIRELDPPEQDFIHKKRIRMLPPGEIGRIAGYLNGSRNTAYVHIDLDVLDPREYRNVKCPVRHGISFKELENSLSLIAGRRDIAGISLLENTECDTERMKVLDGVIKAGLSL